jgi:NTE family protein
VIKAFAEAGIPIDLVAGTSMGAMVAASVALGHQPDVMIEKFLRAFRRNPIADYTIPVIALTRGRRMRRLLMEHCGDAEIENTWKTFFCVSANLSSGEATVHKGISGGRCAPRPRSRGSFRRWWRTVNYSSTAAS